MFGCSCQVEVTPVTVAHISTFMLCCILISGVAKAKLWIILEIEVKMPNNMSLPYLMWQVIRLCLSCMSRFSGHAWYYFIGIDQYLIYFGWYCMLNCACLFPTFHKWKLEVMFWHLTKIKNNFMARWSVYYKWFVSAHHWFVVIDVPVWFLIKITFPLCQCHEGRTIIAHHQHSFTHMLLQLPNYNHSFNSWWMNEWKRH